ncbi:MAG: NUDIX hydrolase [Planctomycetota bacterium]
MSPSETDHGTRGGRGDDGDVDRRGVHGAPRDRVVVHGVRELCRTRIFRVTAESVELPSGTRQELSVVRHAGAVAVAAVDDDGRMVLVRQYRHPAGEWLEEVVAGRIEDGEEPLLAARRELEEEAGLRARSWHLVREFFPAPGFCSERMTLFVARDLELAGDDRRPPDPDEEIEVVRRSPADVLATSRDAKTLIAASFVASRDVDATSF